MSRTITVSSQKGGVGKTTTVIHLAHGLALRGKQVLIVDLDPQGQVAISLNQEPDPSIFNVLVSGYPLKRVIQETAYPRIWLIAGDKRTATAQTVLVAESRSPLEVVKETFVTPFNGKPDFVIFDTAPSVGGLQEGALMAADLIVIPSACDMLALYGVTETLKTLKVLEREGWHGRQLVLPTFYDEVTRQSRENLQRIREAMQNLNIPVHEPIHSAADLREASAYGRTIFDYKPNCRATEEYAHLVFKVLEEVRR
jgi:chromosome partitioning protein